MPASSRYPHLFAPGSIGPLRLKNRVVMAPLVMQYATDTGAPSHIHRAYLAERARGGVGLIMVESCYVDPVGKAFACQAGIHHDSLMQAHVELVETVHRYGARVSIQLHHGGNRADPHLTGGRIVSASAVASDGGQVPDALTTTEIAAVIQRYAEAAARARLAGYDAVEIHGAHGYLLHQFLSPASNKRTDEYGGSVRNRLRFPLEVIRAVRRAVGNDYPLLFRLSTEGGYGIEDAVAFASELEAAGLDALHVSVGGTAPITVIPPGTSPMVVPQGYLTGFSQAIKQAVRIPVVVVGEMREPAFAEEVLAQGKADFIALGRTLLADPHWAAKAAAGRDGDILRCMSCDHCRHCLRLGVPVRCLINPRLGREHWLGEPEPATTPKKVMVVGAGPGGMEAARVAALRGHHVSLYEAGKALGDGQLRLAQVPPFKEKIGWLKEYLAACLAQLPVEVHLGAPVDAAAVAREAPDALIVATGAVPLVPDIPGVNGDNVVTAHALLGDGAAPRGKRVTVLGGRRVGCETAEYLARAGNRVTIVARSPASQLADDAPPLYRTALLVRLGALKVEFITEHDVREIQRAGLTLVDRGGATRFLAADLVVLARGALSKRTLAEKVQGQVAEVRVIGDSEEPRTIAEAMFEGTMAGRQV